MVRFIIVMILMALASFLAITVMPWWSPMVMAFLLILLLPMNGFKAFMATALGTALSYIIITVKTDMANAHILSSKMSVLFFHNPSFIWMIVVTAFIGFITAGLGGLTAATLRQLFVNKNI